MIGKVKTVAPKIGGFSTRELANEMQPISDFGIGICDNRIG